MQINLQKLVLYFIAAVWFVNGFFCKVLNLVPRHQRIVSEILGGEYAVLLTKAIGVAEILMAVWVLSGFKSRLCAVTQMVIVALMNVLEFRLVPDILLFGKLNGVFALFFILLVYYHEFVMRKDRPES